MHEASLHEPSTNHFLTLTYNDANLPANGSIDVRTTQLFMKKLRKHYGSGIRYFLCGEYGDQTNRPHYHALIFGLTITDKVPHKKQRDHVLWISQTLDTIWGLGHVYIGSVTFESAAYVARYITKKQTGPAAVIYEGHLDHETGEVFEDRQPPFVTMSRRPGIAHNWVRKFPGDVFPSDHIVDIEGGKHPVPRYYENILSERALARLKGQRAIKAREHADNNTPERLKVREQIQLAKFSKLERNL